MPLRDGINDETYKSIFVPVMQKVMEVYQPTALVLQCGADSLSGDRLGCFNLSVRGHGECVKHMLTYRIPTLMLGGGGYTIRNVARLWTYETAVCNGEELENELPYNDYYAYYGPDFALHYGTNATMENANTRQYIDSVKQQLQKNSPNTTPDESMLAALAVSQTVDIVQLIPPIAATGYVGVSMYVDDKGQGKGSPPNERASQICTACGLATAVVGDAFIARAWDDQVLRPTSYFLLPTSYLLLPTSCLLLPTSRGTTRMALSVKTSASRTSRPTPRGCAGCRR